MLRCEYCQVDLPGKPKRCPLCQNKPAGVPDNTEDRFPYFSERRQTVSRKLFAWIAFGSVCAATICITVNLILPAGGWWSLFVIAGIASLWVDFGVVIKKRKNLPKTILWQVAIISFVAWVWDLLTGMHGWSVDYVLPLLCSGAMLAIILIAKMRRLEIQNYIFYLLLNSILGLVSFVLILTDFVRIVIPSAISFCVSIIFLAFMLFFERKTLAAEIQRRLHL